jgi:hypothetical protein
MKIEEQFCAAKTGHAAECEDAIYVGEDFAAVIDGMSSKTKRRWDGATGGRLASQAILAAMPGIPPAATFREAIDLLTEVLRKVYLRYDCFELAERDPRQRAAAAMIVYSRARRELWSIGDCQALIGDEFVCHRKYVDEVTTAARAYYLKSELLRGADASALIENDPGRAFIAELLERQTYFQNNPAAGEYFYAMLDGFPVPEKGLFVQPIPARTTALVLASDGYPALKSTLKESEAARQTVIRRDPLLIEGYKSTKGARAGWLSFDDRAYLRLTIPSR